MNLGEALAGPGIAPGTEISGFPFGAAFPFVELSKPTTSEQSGVHLSTSLAPAGPAQAIQEGLALIPAIATDNLYPGNVFVKELEVKKSTHFYKVVFAGDLAGTEPALTATSTLTGPGAGVTFTPGPAPEAKRLSVATFGAIAPGAPQFTDAPADCPPASKIGTVRIDSPAVIDHPLEGSIFLATPNQNPFDSVLALYIAVDDPVSGLVLKLPAEVVGDPATGQLTTTFSETPQLPFEDLQFEFFKGAGAPLKTGIACGTFAVHTEMTPWTAPEGGVAQPEDSFEIERGAGAGPCVKDEASAPNTPKFEAGTFEPTAGLYSPFTLKIARVDGSQRLTGIDATLPKGLLARLAGVPYCSDAALASAASSTGKAEQASPACPAASRVGSVTVGAGAGPTPVYANGSVYLAGPYKGAPLSLAVVAPAVAGPFDLGTVVVRNALYINPETAQVHAVSDPIPSILKGIPLDLRTVLLNLDRGKFTKNPTSCNPLAITGSITALSGQSSPYSQNFQVGDCNKLGFKPKLTLALKGGTKRTGHPALRAVLTGRDRRLQHRPRRRLPAQVRAARQLPHQNRLHPGPVRRRSLPRRLGLRPRKGGDAAARRADLRPRLPAQLLARPARPGRRPPRPDRCRPRRAHRHRQGGRHPHHLRKRSRRPGVQLRPRTAGRQEGAAGKQHQPLRRTATGRWRRSTARTARAPASARC